MPLKEVFALAKIWRNFAGISLLTAVRRPERSESLQGVVGVSKANGEVKTNSGTAGSRQKYINKRECRCILKIRVGGCEIITERFIYYLSLIHI